MRRNILLFIGIFAFSAQAHAPAGTTRHLVYQFGYNTPVASSGNGTGTTAVTLTAAPDGGLMVTAKDHWWNTVRARASNTCEVYNDGRVNCSQPPNSLSPMQLTLFPTLGRDYFKGLGAGGTATWNRQFTAYLAILPGASGFAGTAYTWKCSYALHGQGLIPKAGQTYLIHTNGTLVQQGGTYLKATSKQRIAYDRSAKIPVVIRDVRTHIPVRSVYNNDLIELKLIKDSGWK